MINIAICDDDAAMTGQIESLLLEIAAKQNVKVDCEVYFDGDALLNSIYQNKLYDLIYLDIEMAKVNGISAALQIRDMELSTLIIFISGYENHYKEIVDTELFRFMSKPIDAVVFEMNFMAAYRKISRKTEYFSFMYNKTYQKIAIKNIYYFESKNRIATMYTQNSTERFYQKMNDIEKELSECNSRFLRIHQSYLVNFDYIKSMNFTEVTLTIGQTLQISEDRQKNIRKLFCSMSGIEVMGDEY